MSDNPFAEPDDDRTVFRPMPGGRRGARVASRATAPPAEAAPQSDPPPLARGADLPTLVAAFSNPLIAAASPLLQLLARLRNTAAPPDQGDMRDRTARELREFERRAHAAGVPMAQVRPAHYALCASLDDVVLNTPWGAQGRWRERTLSATFHNDDGAGNGFFDQLRLMRDEPAQHLHVLELMSLCLSLGFKGRFRGVPDGAERLERIRAQTYELIRAGRGGPPPPLAADWEGVDAPYRPRRTRLPIWVAAAGAVAAVAAGFVVVLEGLNAGSDRLLERALAAPPAAMPQILRPPTVRPPPPPPEPPPPGSAERLRAALGADLAQRQLEVIATPSATIVRLPSRVLFAPQTATLAEPAEALLERVARALKGQAGPIRVLGYGDRQPLRTVKFPSTFALSKARAQTVRDRLDKSLGLGGALAAEGRADTDPIASRVDLVLPR